MIRGVGLNPSTPIDALEPLLDDLEYVLILGDQPGLGRAVPSSGHAAGRLERARRMIEASGRRSLLGVDGGVTRDNIAEVAGLGADVIVSGSAIFDGTDAMANAAHMLDAVAAERGRRAGPG